MEQLRAGRRLIVGRILDLILEPRRVMGDEEGARRRALRRDAVRDVWVLAAVVRLAL